MSVQCVFAKVDFSTNKDKINDKKEVTLVMQL